MVDVTPERRRLKLGATTSQSLIDKGFIWSLPRFVGLGWFSVIRGAQKMLWYRVKLAGGKEFLLSSIPVSQHSPRGVTFDQGDSEKGRYGVICDEAHGLFSVVLDDFDCPCG